MQTFGVNGLGSSVSVCPDLTNMLETILLAAAKKFVVEYGCKKSFSGLYSIFFYSQIRSNGHTQFQETTRK